MRRYGGSVDGLDFKFDIKYTGDIACQLTVGILGLGRDTIQRLTVWNYAQAITRGRKIAVYAGYEKDGLPRPIATGIITQAIPTSPPEMWLNFTCLIGKMDYDPKDPLTMRDTTPPKILAKIAEMNGCESRWDTKKNSLKKVLKYYLNAAPSRMVSKFADDFNVYVYWDDGVLVATNRNAWMTNKVIAASEVIGPGTGLLAIGSVDLKGATIRRRLDVRSRLMTWVRLESEIIPSASEDYFVIGRRHVGQFRGSDWYTELKMIRRVSK
jgi:hypothetical protein